MLKDWSRNKFPFYTLPPKRDLTSFSQSKDETMESIYKKHDEDAVKNLKSIKMLWAAEGLVEFEASTIDSREVILTPVETPSTEEVPEEEDAELEDDEELDVEENEEIVGVSDSEDESDEGSMDASEEAVEVTGPIKRKRQGPSEPERNVKKKVTFAKPPPKQAKQQKVQVKQPRKVGNARKIKSNTSSAVDDEAYDFSKFF